ncbi:MAG: calcium/sodium antiporter [Pirellulaceae bacterium]
MIIAIQLMAGFILLIIGAEFLVRGAGELALLFGMTPLVIGLTVVALGTSSPEFAVSIQSAMAGKADLAVGNAVGSNTLNVLLILGLSAMIIPLSVRSQVVKLDVPVMVAATIVLLLVANDGEISRIEGICFLVALSCYLIYLIRIGRREALQEQAAYLQESPERIISEEDRIPTRHKIALQVGLVVGGLILLAVGCRLFVFGSSSLARVLGVSELIIGLTVVSVGTSLPELVTCVIASIRGQRDMAVGNIVGSNLFNILGVLGLTSVIAEGGLPVASQAIGFDIPVTLAAAVICLPIFFTDAEISRWEGGLMFVLYLCYAAYLVLSANQMEVTDTFANVVRYAVIPVTALLLIGSTLWSLRGGWRKNLSG